MLDVEDTLKKSKENFNDANYWKADSWIMNFEFILSQIILWNLLFKVGLGNQEHDGNHHSLVVYIP